jgi:hypothetical protein
MSTSRRRHSFHPAVDGFRLEDRVVLSTSSSAVAATSTATGIDPLVPTNHGTLKAGYVQATGTQLLAAFQTFEKQVNKAAQNAIKAVGNGQTEANAVTSLSAYTTLQGGVLEARVQQICNRLPGGVQYLFNPPQGTVPGGYPTNGTSGPDIRYYVAPPLRLKTQIDNMLATLNADASTLQSAVSQNSALTIVQTSQSCKATMRQFINFATTNGDFTIVNG